MPTPNSVPTAILAIRLSCNDTITSNYAASDNLEAQVDGSRKVFKFSNRNVVIGNASAFYIQDNGTATLQDPTDPVNGLNTQGSAPQASLEWYYYFLNFIDAEIQQFLDVGLGEVGLTEQALVNIQQGLWTVVSHYASAEFYNAMMAKFAQSFNSAVEGETYDMADIFKAYKALHDSHIKDGDAKREEFYKKQGRRFQTYSRSASAYYPPNGLQSRR